MQRSVLKAIARQRLISKGATVVVAVSGGLDSVVLLDVLANLPEMGLRLVVAHLNHMLRGEESDGDEAFVRELALAYRLPFEAARIDVRELGRSRRLCLEEAGREARYGFLRDVAGKYGAECTALGHHAGDQAETMLMRLLRGSAITGLCAMAPKSADGRYVRPLLHLEREELEAYALSGHLPFRTDSSNSDTNFLRNRVRHELIPLLARYNPSIVARLGDTASAVAADEALLEQVVASAFDRLATVDAQRVSFAVEALGKEPRAVRMRLYRRALVTVKGDLRSIGYRHLDSVDALVAPGRPNRRVCLPDGAVAARSYGQLDFSGPGRGPVPADFELLVEGPGSYPLPGGRVLLISEEAPPEGWRGLSPRTAFFEPAAVPFPWLVRPFRPGDRFVPLGMAGHKKVKDLFIDAKVPLGERKSIPLIFSEGRLIWVCGFRMGEGARVPSGAQSCMMAVIEP